jgi:CRISPR-associated protein Cas1
MRKLLNTLYITTPNAYLIKDGLNLVVTVEKNEIFRIPIVNIESVVYFGYLGASPGAIKLCNDNGVSISYFTPSGRFIAHVTPPTHGNVILRMKQYQTSRDESFALHLSRNIIGAKIQNSRNVLRRFIRDNGDNEPIAAAADTLDRIKRRALNAENAGELRGMEGEAANRYFSVFNQLILHQNSDFPFNGRSKYPPRDAVNAMLSFAYTLITNDMVAALESVGLDPNVGFLHTIRPGRASLSLDVIEDLRAYLGDRFVLSLINRRQITKHDFKPLDDDNSVIMTDNGRKLFLQAWQSKKKEEIVHPYLNEKIPIGLLPYVQSQLLARYIRGDIDDYPVFIMK